VRLIGDEDLCVRQSAAPIFSDIKYAINVLVKEENTPTPQNVQFIIKSFSSIY